MKPRKNFLFNFGCQGLKHRKQKRRNFRFTLWLYKFLFKLFICRDFIGGQEMSLLVSFFLMSATLVENVTEAQNKLETSLDICF